METKFNISNDSIIVVHAGKSHNVPRSAPNFNQLRLALVEERFDDVPKFLTVEDCVRSWAKGDFNVVDMHRIEYKGDALPSELCGRIIEMAGRNEDPAPFFNFWERLQRNPSARSVSQLFGFLQQVGIPIQPDGTFLAYKAVRADMMDKYTGTVDNKVGVVNEMARNKISDDPDVACHFGFHVGSQHYAENIYGSSGDRLIICKVEPENVVCVPKNHSQQKVRVCKYEVYGHHGSTMSNTTAPFEPFDEHSLVVGGGEGMELTDVVLPWEEDMPPSTPDQLAGQDATVTPTGVVVPHRFEKFNTMSYELLMKESIEGLREYAGAGLRIVGASKIPGGKLALVKRILDVRG